MLVVLKHIFGVMLVVSKLIFGDVSDFITYLLVIFMILELILGDVSDFKTYPLRC